MRETPSNRRASRSYASLPRRFRQFCRRSATQCFASVESRPLWASQTATLRCTRFVFDRILSVVGDGDFGESDRSAAERKRRHRRVGSAQIGRFIAEFRCVREGGGSAAAHVAVSLVRIAEMQSERRQSHGKRGSVAGQVPPRLHQPAKHDPGRDDRRNPQSVHGYSQRARRLGSPVSLLSVAAASRVCQSRDELSEVGVRALIVHAALAHRGLPVHLLPTHRAVHAVAPRGRRGLDQHPRRVQPESGSADDGELRGGVRHAGFGVGIPGTTQP